MSQEKAMLIINNPDRKTLRVGDLVFSYEFFQFFSLKHTLGKLFRFEELKDGVIKVTQLELPTVSGKHWTTKDLVAVGAIAFFVALVGGVMIGYKMFH